MSDETRKKGQDFAKFIEGLSPEEIERGNEANIRQTEEQYKRFVEGFEKDHCYLCDKPFRSFSRKRPCVHWLLKPKGFKKKDFPLVTENFGLFQIQSYLRWVANQDAMAKNINDLPDEEGVERIVGLTIKHGDLEWSMSCSESDYLGHSSTKHARHPHYHFQMRIDGGQFINYNDFHVPLSEMDVVNIEAMRTAPDKIKHKFHFGEGMFDVLTDETAEVIVNTSKSTESEEDAQFKLDTIVVAEDGGTISGDDLAEIIKEAKSKGVTVASLMHKLPNAETKTVVSAGPGVVEQAPRSGRKRRRKRSDS